MAREFSLVSYTKRSNLIAHGTHGLLDVAIIVSCQNRQKQTRRCSRWIVEVSVSIELMESGERHSTANSDKRARAASSARTVFVRYLDLTDPPKTEAFGLISSAISNEQ